MIKADRRTTDKLVRNQVSVTMPGYEPKIYKKNDEYNELYSESQMLHSGNNYIFSPGRLPPRRQMFYQLQDVQIQSVQAKLSDREPTHYLCTKQDGWLRPGDLAAIRGIIVEEIKRTKLKIKEDIGKSVASF